MYRFHTEYTEDKVILTMGCTYQTTGKMLGMPPDANELLQLVVPMLITYINLRKILFRLNKLLMQTETSVFL
jgi:hypothetical protein